MATGSKVQVIGPLAAHLEGFYEALAASGYGRETRSAHARVLEDLSRWLVSECLEPGELSTGEVERFLAHRKVTGATMWISTRGISPLLEYLRLVEAIPPVVPASDDALSEVLGAYRRYMSLKRRLAELTIERNEGTARRFLLHHAKTGELCDLEAYELNCYIVARAAHLSASSTGILASSLRDFVRFLYATGVVPHDLSGAIPGAASARLASLPKGLDHSVVARLLESCDRAHPGGLRDFAILKLLARLGLRAIEVSSMRLDDIDWRAGEFVVRGKGQRRDRLPLPADVGEALADYLANGRPSFDSRAVFLRTIAPMGPISRNGVVFVSRNASHRAGIPVVGAHRLRHTVATEMLARGASLREIAQILRHESEQTTAIYAKVDRAALEHAVHPWPVTP